MDRMSIVKINAITVPEHSGDELAQRFAARAGAVDGQDGFEGFELLAPTDGRTTWLVVTRWRDEDAFQGWLSSPAFGHGHRRAGDGGEGGDGGDGGERTSGGEGAAQGSGEQRPVGMSSELWSYRVAGGSDGGGEP
jgi:heme oxygenase (mycobilin-producing)